MLYIFKAEQEFDMHFIDFTVLLGRTIDRLPKEFKPKVGLNYFVR